MSYNETNYIGNLAPIILFTYNRLQETKKTIEALQKNHLATDSVLYIFSDGAKNDFNAIKVREVRKFLKTISGFKEVIINESALNMGLANSIINGVTQVLKTHDNAIVIEDDLVTSPIFLDFMNQALHFYNNVPEVMSISGYTMNLPHLKDYDKDFYYAFRASSWGWATWQDKWEHIDWAVSDYDEFKNDFSAKMRFFKIGSDMPYMLKNQMKGKIDSWAIRWCYHQYKNNLLTVYPSKSKLISIGMSENATHTKGATKFMTPLDKTGKRNFTFDDSLNIDKQLILEFKRKFSLIRRSRDKMLRMINSLKK